MAKQAVGPVERHIEKFAVGLAGVLLLGVVAQYLVTSPNVMDLGNGEPVAPTAVDAALASEAREVTARIRSSQSAVELPQPLYDDFVASLDPFTKEDLSSRWPVVAPIQPEVPIVDPPDIVLGVQRLAKVLQMPKPAVTSGRSTLNVESDEGGQDGPLMTANWATVSSLFDRASQAKQFSDTYGATNSDVIFAGVELQRRIMRPDGGWDDNWTDVKPWPAAQLSAPPTLTLESDHGRLEVPRDQYNKLTDYLDELSQGEQQIDIIRPLFVTVVNGAPWSFPQIVTYHDLLVQDDEYLFPEEASQFPLDRYKLQGGTETKETAIKKVKKTPRELIQSGKEKLQNAKTADDATRAYNDFFSVKDDPNATAQELAEARRWADQAEQVERDFRRSEEFGRNRSGGSLGDNKPNAKKKRERLPHQQLWAHDARKGSLQAGRTYQYRIRAVLYNVLAGEPNKFDNPAFGKVVLLRGPWSPPSGPVIMEDTVRYFVTSFNKRRKQVSVEFYQWWDGVWVKNRDVFAVGEKLAKTARADVPDIDDPTKADHTPVPFSADATILEIDFDRSYRDRVRAASREGVAYGAPTGMCSVVLLDSGGQLHERFVPVDKANPDKTAYAARVWKAPRGVSK